MFIRLRFKEFSDSWIETKIGEITSKVGSGSTPRGGEEVYQSSGIQFIRSQNVNNEQLLLDDVTYISDEINAQMKGSIVKANDILLNITGASIGRSCVVPSNFLIGNVNQHVCIIRLKADYIPRFLQPYLSSSRGQKSISSTQVGSGREGLNFEAIRSFKVSVPALLEQTKIANFLTAVDEKIHLLTRKHDLLTQYKKGVMQQIFSQELRFKDDDGQDFPNWEETTLGEISVKKSSNIAANKIEENEGEYKIYGAAGVLKKVDFFTQNDAYISIVKDGAGVGRVFLCEPKTSVLGTMDMHAFSELVQHSALFSLNALETAQQSAIEGLQTSAATPLVKALQMVQLQKVISAVGMFSIFDAILQEQLQCADGFREAVKLLDDKGEAALKERFSDLQLAINVLKHGKGWSYDTLVLKASSLPFRVKLPDEAFFNEGDVAEISTLVEVDDAFVLLCAKVIYEVSISINSLSQNGA